MNDVCYHIKSMIDGSIQPARCKHCRFFNLEFDKYDRVSYFGYCSVTFDRKPRNRFACALFDSKGYFQSIDKVVQFTLFDHD